MAEQYGTSRYKAPGSEGNMVVGTHVGLTVSDLRKSLDFYVTCLGFKVAEPRRVVEGPEIDKVQGLTGVKIEVAYLANGALALELMSYLRPIKRGKKSAVNKPGCHHLSFAVPDVVALYETLKARGVEFVGPPGRSPRSGRYTVMLFDPDGCIVELTQGGGFSIPQTRDAASSNVKASAHDDPQS